MRAAVIAATLELLAEGGPAALSVSAVATRSGVHETTIYRRWGTRDRLMFDAVIELSAELLPLPDTGSIRGDLQAFGLGLVAYGASPLGQGVLRSFAAVVDDDETAVMRADFWPARFDQMSVLVERAKERGELPAAADARSLLEVFLAPIHFRLLLTRETIDPAFLRTLADIAVEGVKARHADD